jgi:hypothetical protein
MMNGVWDFMEQLDLDEAEVDQVVEEILEFVSFSHEIGPSADLLEKSEAFEPRRSLDHNTLWLKTGGKLLPR